MRESPVESALKSSLAAPTDTNTPMPRQLLGATTDLSPGPVGDPSAAYPRPGDVFLGFNIVEKLGEGGFGSVFLAEEVKLGGRPVVLKFTNRPNREPERLASLQHANIVPVYSVHTMSAMQVICMPYLGRQTLQSVVDTVTSTLGRTHALPQSGSALLSSDATSRAEGKASSKPNSKWKSRIRPRSSHREALRQEPANPAPAAAMPQPIRDRLHRLSFKESVVWLFTRLAEGLQHAHERGILHLDMKPLNILMTNDGVPMILDFGLAYDTKSGNYDQTGGTPKYMSPEQLSGYSRPGSVQPDARMDLYALGLMFFELLAGVHPFEKSSEPCTPIHRMREARRGQPPKVRELNPNVDPAVEAIVLKLLQPDPARRYQSAQDLVTDLVLHQDNRPVKFAGNPSLWERVRKMRRRHPILAVAMVAGLLALSTTGAVATAAHEARQRSQAEASLQARNFHRELKAGRVDLATMDRAEDRRAAIRRAEALLSKYGVESPGDWRSQPAFEHLGAEEQKQLGRDLVELAALVAHAHRLNAIVEKDAAKAESYERALHYNALSTRLNLGQAPLVGLELQREELLHLAKLTNEEPRRTTPMTEPLDYYLAGLAGMARGHNNQAAEAFKALLETNPEHAAGQLGLGWVYQYQGKFAEASEHFQLAKVLAPKDPRPAFNRGVLLQFHRKYPAAIEEFNAAAARNPNFATTYYYRALTYRKMGKFEEAVADCNRAIEGNEMVYASLILRAELHEELHNPVAASVDRHAVENHEPRTESEYFARGRSKLAADPKGALADFDRALEMNPRYLTAWMNKANVLNERLGEPRQALAAYERVMELHPRSASTMAVRAAIHARLGETEDALKLLDKVKPGADDPQVWFDCARAYATLGRNEQAVEMLKRAFLDGFSDFAKVARASELQGLRDTVAFRSAVQAAKELQPKK
jgi:serine/threonine protein kinase/Tfp pilus assembly protein PilF